MGSNPVPVAQETGASLGSTSGGSTSGRFRAEQPTAAIAATVKRTGHIRRARSRHPVNSEVVGLRADRRHCTWAVHNVSPCIPPQRGERLSAPCRCGRTHYLQRPSFRNRTGCIEYAGRRRPRTGSAHRGRTPPPVFLGPAGDPDRPPPNACPPQRRGSVVHAAASTSPRGWTAQDIPAWNQTVEESYKVTETMGMPENRGV